MSKATRVTSSSGNVFADLGLPHADELRAKAELVRQISHITTARGLNQCETATILGTTQPKVSDLLRGRLSGFSMERLIRFLNALDHDVEIVVRRKPRTRQRARVRVSVD